MLPPRLALCAIFATLLLETACNQRDIGTLDIRDAAADAGMNTSAADAAPLDASLPLELDASLPLDASASLDASEPEDASLPEDASFGTVDGGAACNYLDTITYIVRCDAAYEYLRRFEDQSGLGCSEYYGLLGTEHWTLEDALVAHDCSGECLYAPSISVSFIDHCGRRNGYFIFRDQANAVACPELYEFSNGLFPSLEAWEEATPCPS